MEVTAPRRRTKEQTREHLLDTGGQLLTTRGPSLPVQHVRLVEALKAAGLTVGAAYRIWDRQEDYHRDLGRWAARWCRDRIADRLGQAAEFPGADPHGRLGALVTLLVDGDDQRLAGSLTGAAALDPEVDLALRERTDLIVGALRRGCHEWLLATGRRLRVSTDLDEVATVIAQFALGVTTFPAPAESGGLAELPRGAVTLIEGWSEPVPPARVDARPSRRRRSITILPAVRPAPIATPA